MFVFCRRYLQALFLALLPMHSFAFWIQNNAVSSTFYYEYPQEQVVQAAQPAPPLQQQDPVIDESVIDEDQAVVLSGEGTSSAPASSLRPVARSEVTQPEPEEAPAPAPPAARTTTEARRNCSNILMSTHFRNHGSRLIGGDRPLRICEQAGGAISYGDRASQANSAIMSEVFAEFLEEHMLRCTNEALTNSGIEGRATAVHVVHAGSYVHRHRNHNSNDVLSFHASGRALDITQLVMSLDNGRQRTYSFHRDRRSRNFYSDFVGCFREAIIATCPNAGWTRRGSSQGVIDANTGPSSLYRRHIHVALPYCRRSITGMSTY